jgi:integrase/recombinase XerD
VKKLHFLNERDRKTKEFNVLDFSICETYTLIWQIREAVMLKKRAKILSNDQINSLLNFTATTRNETRNRVLVLLSIRAGLRAGEIAALTWDMVLDPSGAVADHIELRDHAAKKKSGRLIPLHRDLKDALTAWLGETEGFGPVVLSQRGGHMTPVSIVNFFAQAYAALGFDGCSSHSGRRTFITRAARLVHQAGGSLRDVQILAGHKSIAVTQGYIEGDTDAQRRLVALV